VLVTTLGGIELVGLSGIVVGPLVAALFLTAWQILTDQRHRHPAGAPLVVERDTGRAGPD
jgi:predicted PurR-regulated permease PerM